MFNLSYLFLCSSHSTSTSHDLTVLARPACPDSMDRSLRLPCPALIQCIARSAIRIQLSIRDCIKEQMSILIDFHFEECSYY